MSIDQKKASFSLWGAGTLRKKGILELQGTAAQGIDSSSNRLEWQVQLARNWERHAVLFAEKGSILTLTHCGDKLDLLQINKQRLKIGYNSENVGETVSSKIKARNRKSLGNRAEFL